MAIAHEIIPYFRVNVDREYCKKCKRCINHCSFGALSFNGEQIVAADKKCVACQRCVVMCPGKAICIVQKESSGELIVAN